MKNVYAPYNHVEIFCTNQNRRKLQFHLGEYYLLILLENHAEDVLIFFPRFHQYYNLLIYLKPFK